MGGPGSSRWGNFYEGKITVEECWLLPSWRLKRELAKLPDEVSSGTRQAIKISTGQFKPVSYFIEPSGGADGGPILELHYTVGRRPPEGADPIVKLAHSYIHNDPFGPDVELPIELTYTEPHFGGKRWWFCCPLITEEGWECGRRVAKLWLPPGERFFGCSECYNLTHKSSLECHAFDKMARQVGAYAPDDETRGVVVREFKAAISWSKAEYRKSREHRKTLMDIFEDAFGAEG